MAETTLGQEPGITPPHTRIQVATMTVVLLLGILFATPGSTRADDVTVTDADVEAAIQRAVTWLKSQRNETGHWETDTAPDHRFWTGNSGLALLALLYAGENPRQDDMNRSLEWLAAQSLRATYTYGTRAHVFALVPGNKFRARLEQDLAWLLEAVGKQSAERAAGAYDYEAPADNRDLSRYDNSNSQYGVLGTWMAAEAGLSIPEWYWPLVGDHWMRDQQPDGGWTYKDSGNSTGSMTAAGLATLYVVLDHAYSGDEGPFNGTMSARCGQHKESSRLLSAIARGMDWLGREYTPDENPHGGGRWKYYYLYGVERVGRASGQKHLRQRDWFREGAAHLLEKQQPDGSWTDGGALMDDVRNTCFALMFLCHGRAPLLFNKLEHGDDWNNKLRDVAGLTRFAQQSFERLLNWQIVRLDGPLDDLMEAPVLYMSGHTAWEFSEVEVQKLREYCQRGGLILGVACCSKEEFNTGFRALARKMFPDLPLRPVAPEHPLLNGEVRVRIEEPPPLFEVHNGVRTLMLLSPKDICAPWNQYRVRRWEHYFQLACNIYLYATDKTSIRSRLQTPNIPMADVDIERTIRVARLKYNGRWNVEPYGWTRLKFYMNNETNSRLLVTSGVTLDSPDLQEFKVAHISGITAFELSEEEMRGLRRFLTGGGTLLADAVGGSREFTESLETYLTQILKTPPQYLQADSVVLTGEGLPAAQPLTDIAYRRAARSLAGGRKFPPLKACHLRRRIAVIYSPLDLSASLLGTHVYDCRGYEGESALRIARNLLLYAQSSTAEKARLIRSDDE
ncbi:MAG: DUF4159 domain-containing protein [Planctomycetes bacterium]|nr:DUF4159 domain-containing protein [Planctomycetota bacterium]